MKSIPKLIKRFVGILLVSSLLIIILNFAVIAIVASSQTAGGTPWTTASETADSLQKTESGYILSGDIQSELSDENVWAILIDDSTHKVVWHTDNLPPDIPLEYSLSDISSLTRGYVKDYPTFTGEAEEGLVVLGYPKDRYWKHMWPQWDYSFIAHLPRTLLSILGVNVALIFLIYVTAGTRLLKSVKPIAEGIQALPTGNPIHIREKGVLSGLAANVNQTSEILQSQNHQLKKRETARVNWIAGVSHDIRTPLSTVMGYAGQLENDSHLTEDGRKKAAVIRKQSERMKNLIKDLNLASKLEYNMQPLNVRQENAVAVVRQVVVDFINIDMEGRYPVEWLTDDSLSVCIIHADRELLKRAVSNLFQNCINHNENGCTIYVSVVREEKKCVICVEDDGVGASEEQIEKLNNTPHYMVCDENTTEQRHGLGLLIVKQVATSLGGETVIGHSRYGGFSVKIMLPAVIAHLSASK